MNTRDQGADGVDILLIVPPWLTKDGNIWNGVKGTWPPLGILNIAAYAERRGHSVRVLDVIAEQIDFEEIQRVICDLRPRFVGLTSVTAQINSAHRVTALVKRVLPESIVVVGGSHATALPEEVLQDANVDYVVCGEGEKPLAAIVEGEPVESIPGLSYRSGNPLQPIQHNPIADPIQDLDSLPIPAYHLVRFECYKPAVGAYRRLPAIAMTITRGCPGKCTFCGSAETPFRTRSAANVVDEIQHLQERYGIREISFYDDTFTVSKRNVVEFCDLIGERGIDVTWSCFARTDCVSEMLLRKMRKAGCHQILYGVESADPEILENIRKPIDLDKTRKAVRMTQKAGIMVRAAFMLGNPGETVQSMRRTIDFAKQLNPDIALFNITVPFPGTEMFAWAKKNGYLRSYDWRDYDIASAVLDLPTVSSEEVNRMYRVAYHEFYFRPRYLLRRLLKLRNFEDIKMSFQAVRSILSVRATRPSAELEKGPSRQKRKSLRPSAAQPASGAC